MLVSILVPIYKVEKYITRCLDSIFYQTYTDIEYVFVNDCTPDNSMLILNRFIDKNAVDKDKIKIISHSVNQGIAVTRNDCIANASGEYVLFVDSDDWIEPDMVKQLVKATDGGKIDIVGCDYCKNYADGTETMHYEDYTTSPDENLIRCLNYNIATALWKVLVRKTLFSKFIFRPDIEIGEDYVATVMLYYYADSCSYVHRNMYHYSQYNENRYSEKISKSISEHILAVNEVEKFLNNVGRMDVRAKHELDLRKFSIKSYYLSKGLRDYKKWENVFPEANAMWRFLPYSPKEKLKFWLAEKGMFSVLKLIQG